MVINIISVEKVPDIYLANKEYSTMKQAFVIGRPTA